MIDMTRQKLFPQRIKRYAKFCSEYNCSDKPTMKVKVDGIIIDVCFDHCIEIQKNLSMRTRLK